MWATSNSIALELLLACLFVKVCCEGACVCLHAFSEADLAAQARRAVHQPIGRVCSGHLKAVSKHCARYSMHVAADGKVACVSSVEQSVGA